MNRFHNQVALVTGAAQGIGRRVAERLAEEGARVVLVDRSELVFELAAELSPRYPVLALTADLEQYRECSRIMAAAIAHFGRLDVLINNVGGTIWAKPFEHYEPAQIEAEVRRSLFPTLWCCHAALPQMLEQGSGAIVNVSSIATRSLNRVPYGAAKGGINALTACLAFENAERGIRVNAVAPGWVGTENILKGERWKDAVKQIPIGRLAEPGEIAGVVAWLCSETAGYITGEILNVNGGMLMD